MKTTLILAGATAFAVAGCGSEVASDRAKPPSPSTVSVPAPPAPRPRPVAYGPVPAVSSNGGGPPAMTAPGHTAKTDAVPRYYVVPAPPTPR